MLTLERLKELLHYNPLTGLFTWRVRRGGIVTVGTPAGSVDDHGYISIEIDYRRYRGHRLAWFYMTGNWPDPECDHEDRNRQNNCWANLRPATRSQNNANKSSERGIKGVSWHNTLGKWVAYIKHDSKQIHLGCFADKNDAAACYNYHAAWLYGDFAVLNPIPVPARA